MSNLLQSSQSQTTCAPSYYTNYLQNLICKGQQAQAGAQYVGAQPLQQQAFQSAAQNQGAYSPIFQQAQSTLGCAANQNITGAGAGYIQQAASKGGLCAASPYLQQGAGVNVQGAGSPYIQQAAGMNPAQMAQQYMSPYLQTAVQNVSDIAQRNIQQNLAPQATAAAVGSGQFGSQRGAQVLGQIEAQANQCLNNTIASMENTGYNTAMCTAIKQQQLLGNLGSISGCLAAKQANIGLQAGQTAGTLAQQQQNLLGTLGQTSGCLAAKQAAIRTQAAQGLTGLGSCVAKTNINCLNALATLGGQQQTIAQNQQTFPLQTLSSLASIMQGAQIPMGTKQTMCMSPLSGIGTGLGLLAGIGQNQGNISSAISGIGKLFGLGGSGCCYKGSCSQSYSANNDMNNLWKDVTGGLDPTASYSNPSNSLFIDPNTGQSLYDPTQLLTPSGSSSGNPNGGP
jgi:hypothetical protein